MKKYKAGLKDTARILRNSLTDTEKHLWKHLKNKQIAGVKFRRQQPIGDYIVDFINFENKLIIEVDGGQHAIYKRKDITRDEYLRQEGYTVLRFWDNEVLTNVEGVFEVIRQNLHPRPHPPPSRGRETRKDLLQIKAEKAIKEAVREVIEEHKQSGRPLVIWRKNRVVKVSADKLK